MSELKEWLQKQLRETERKCSDLANELHREERAARDGNLPEKDRQKHKEMLAPIRKEIKTVEKKVKYLEEQIAKVKE